MIKALTVSRQGDRAAPCMAADSSWQYISPFLCRESIPFIVPDFWGEWDLPNNRIKEPIAGGDAQEFENRMRTKNEQSSKLAVVYTQTEKL